MLIGPNLTIAEVKPGPNGGRITSDDLIKAYASLTARGLRTIWPPLFCPMGETDRFMIAGVPPAPAGAARGGREEPKAPGGLIW